MTEKIKCIHCFSKFDAAKNNKCPKCGMSQSWSVSDGDAFSKLGIAVEEETSSSSEESWGTYTRSQSESSNLDEILDSLLKAQVRTIYAIRSLAIFLFTFLTTFCSGAVAVTIGEISKLTCDYSCDSANTMSALGYIVIGVGFIVALIAGGFQLSLSNPSRH
jgi:hypothetical protein